MAEHYEDASLVRQAALLAVGISQNQPFLEGNKRTAYAAADAFLRLNGLAFRGDPLAFARWLEQVAIHEEGLDAATLAFERWLDQHIG